MSLRYRALPHERIGKLKKLLHSKPLVRVMEVHSGLSAIIATMAEHTSADGTVNEFDALWISSLTDSAIRGFPDAEIVNMNNRLDTIQQILQVTDKPLIVDGDTGGDATQFEYTCSALENHGVSAVIIEDKQFPKRNSLEAGTIQILEDPDQFVTKINRGKQACLSNEFMIFARIESFIAGTGLEDALMRAEKYLVSEADGILIHSNKKTADEIFLFMEKFKHICAKRGVHKPVICVPTTYNVVLEEELIQNGIQVAIYANHQLRAAHKAMKDVCQTILRSSRSLETDSQVISLAELFKDVGFLDIKEKDAKYARQ